MAMKQEDLFQAALKMIHVTPENYLKLDAGIVLRVCEVIAEAEAKQPERHSIYEGMAKEQMLEAMSLK